MSSHQSSTTLGLLLQKITSRSPNYNQPLQTKYYWQNHFRSESLHSSTQPARTITGPGYHALASGSAVSVSQSTKPYWMLGKTKDPATLLNEIIVPDCITATVFYLIFWVKSISHLVQTFSLRTHSINVLTFCNQSTKLVARGQHLHILFLFLLACINI